MKLKACLLLAIWLGPLILTAQASLAERQLVRKLQQRVSVTWQGQQFSEAIERLADIQQVTIWIDRRVDPQAIVNAQIRHVPLQQVLQDIAKRHGLGVVRLGSIVYLGPEQASQELLALSQLARRELTRIPGNLRRKWLAEEQCSWDRLSEPRKLVIEMFRDAEIRLLKSEKIDHDLWPAKKLPPLAFIDRAVLILIGFDLTCQLSPDGKSCVVTKINRPLPQVDRPDFQVPLPRSQEGTPKNTQQVFTLKLEDQPLGRVLDQLGGQLQLDIVWHEKLLAAKQSLRSKRVSCDVQKVGLDELLKSILQAAGLQCERNGQTVTITAGN